MMELRDSVQQHAKLMDRRNAPRHPDGNPTGYRLKEVVADHLSVYTVTWLTESTSGRQHRSMIPARTRSQ
jgi:hypothetical protein